MNNIYTRPGKSGIAPFKIPVILLLGLFLMPGRAGNLRAQTDSLEVRVVPLMEIANDAASDMQQTRDMLVEKIQVTTAYELVPQVDSIERNVANLDELTRQILGTRVDLAYYNSLTLRWERGSARVDPLQASLQKYLANVDETSSRLDLKRDKWALTLEETDASVLSEDIVSRIEGISHYIDSARLILNDSLNSSLALLNRVADVKLIIESNLHDISELQKVTLGKSLLTKEEAIFMLEGSVDTLEIDGDSYFLLHMGIQDTKAYLDSNWPILLILLLCFMGLMIAFIFLKRGYKPDDSNADPDRWYREIIISKPVATAFVFTMLLALWWLPTRPVFMKEIFVILFIIPFLPIYFSLAFKSIRYILVYLFAILLYSILNDYIQTGHVYLRISSLLESLALFSFHVYFLIAKKSMQKEDIKGHFFYQLLNTIQPFYFLLTLLAVVASIIGYWNFAEMVNEAVLMSLLLLLLFATGFFSLIAVLHNFFSTEAADKSLVLKESKEGIYKWLFRYLRIGTAVLWFYYTLRIFFLWDPFMEGVKHVLAIGYEFGELMLTIGNILSFILVIYISWLVSFVIRNLLEVELFGRLKLPRGVPKAVSSLTQYFLITLGFLLALSAAGFSMQNLGLLAGALGVGIGFGLQNIVNNFISGLILAFERPVTVGDVIIVAGHEGVVQKIGIRASTVLQYDGSEVIVPNSELISNRVINWSLTKYTRRMILTIQTNQDADTDQVLKIMTEAAYEVKHVLKKPEAKAYFHGIKDKEFEFALYYWASSNILDCKSMVNQQVQKALRDAGIDFVMPLHVLMQNEEKPK